MTIKTHKHGSAWRLIFKILFILSILSSSDLLKVVALRPVAISATFFNQMIPAARNAPRRASS